MSCQVFSLQHKHILFDQELLADRIAVLCPQTISKTLGDLPRNPVENLKSIPEWMLNIIDPCSVAQYAPGANILSYPPVSMSQGLQSLLNWSDDVSICGINPTISLWSSGYWPMTGLDCHKLSNQAPDNRDCYCVVSRVCAVSSWCPRASLMSDLEKNNTKIHRAAENSTFLAKLCPDIRDWGWGKITRYCLTSNVMEPGHCSQGCQLYPEIGPYLINILIMKILWNPFLIPGTVIVESEIGTLLDLKQ